MTETPSQPGFVGVAMRDLARLRTVAVAVSRHGFGELLMSTPLGPRLLPGILASTGDDADGTPAVRFTQLLGELGPTFTKLGQILSMRKDLLPLEWTTALETLQDRAPVLRFETIRDAVEAGLGAPLEELFSAFDREPLATASIAQTHLATTLSGERVVVKVQRPGIEAVMRSDLDLLFLAAQVLDASIDEMQLIGVSDVVTEFERGILRELDFREELANLLACRQLLDPERNVTVPRPHPELSSRTVLTMQFFAGRPIRELEPGSEAAKRAVEEIVHAACKQVFVDGLFHGDPHSGNLLVDDEGRICMLDLGLVGRLSESQREDLVTLIFATMTGDSGGIARILLKMGTPTQRVSLAELRAEIERIRSKYLVVESLDQVDSTGFAQEFAAAAQGFRIKLAPEYSILVKATTTIEGLVRTLHPSIDLVSIARPYVQQAISRRLSPLAVLQDLAGEASGLASIVARLPAQLDQVLHDVETGSLQIRAVTPELDEVPALLHQMAGRLGLTAFAFAMTLCAAIVLPDADPHWAQITLCVLCALAAAGAWTLLFWWHVVGRGKPLRLAPILRLFRRTGPRA
ncbi:aarF domain-containing kinase [Myxococcaceae bacterium]|jgi:ubiquinone biosynthesis protein|nr:aarF domain-containing kinase [Myxococcaceae bacterium]